MRVVVDTNVMISAVLWLGTPHRIVELAEQKRIVLCMTETLLDELREVLARPKFKPYFQARHTSIEEIFSALLPLIELYSTTTVADAKLSDPDDEMFIACAISADAEYIISGDDHLLRLKQYRRIRILNPTDFLHAVEMKHGNDANATESNAMANST